jgi:predicted deacetylase
VQVSALYVVGEESAEWYYTEVNSATGAMTKRQALARHPANNRGNQVAREKYCSGILKGVLPELRAERAQRAVGAGAQRRGQAVLAYGFPEIRWPA